MVYPFHRLGQAPFPASTSEQVNWSRTIRTNFLAPPRLRVSSYSLYVWHPLDRKNPRVRILYLLGGDGYLRPRWLPNHAQRFWLHPRSHGPFGWFGKTSCWLSWYVPFYRVENYYCSRDWLFYVLLYRNNCSLCRESRMCNGWNHRHFEVEILNILWKLNRNRYGVSPKLGPVSSV